MGSFGNPGGSGRTGFFSSRVYTKNARTIANENKTVLLGRLLMIAV